MLDVANEVVRDVCHEGSIHVDGDEPDYPNIDKVEPGC